MITIVNYGLGNIGAFESVYKRMNVPTTVATRAGDLNDATHVILPGVGTFDHAMELLNTSGLRDPLDDLVAKGDAIVLGVCVGMQILAESSEEGTASGLAWVNGKVRRLSSQPAAAALSMPHMGWNDVQPRVGETLFKGSNEALRFYFLHSYYLDCDDALVAARASYGIDFACAVRQHNVLGVQFHPEKSHGWGARILKNFAEI